MAALSAALAALMAVAVAVAAPPTADATDPAKASAAIVEHLSRADLDALGADAAKYMAPSESEKIKNSFAPLKNLGKSQYTDLLYARDYGQSEKDLIYTINFDRAFVFVRLLWRIDSSRWTLVNIAFKTEGTLPFPKDWEQIYPK